MTAALTARVALALAAAALTVVAAPPASAHEGAGDVATNTRGEQVAERGAGVRMSHVANLQYDRSGEAQNGSDIEFVRIDGRDYALAGTLDLGMQIIDITRPTAPRRAAVYDCKVSQGDIQVWKKKNRGSPATPPARRWVRRARPRAAGATSSSAPTMPAPSSSTSPRRAGRSR